MTITQNTVPTETPWGPIQTRKDHGQGVTFVSTASHGGFYVEPTLNAQIPEAHRRATWNGGQGMAGWYEEDIDWCIVALHFPGRFKPQVVVSAIRTFEQWIEPKIAKAA